MKDSGTLFEEKRVEGLHGIAKVGEAYTDEAVFLIGIESDFCEE